jgi:hypothetical protein
MVFIGRAVLQLLDRLPHHAGAALLLDQGSGVLPRLERRELVVQLHVAGQPLRRQAALRDGLLHGTARLVPMPAVREVAPGRQCLDVAEAFATGLGDVPELQLAHAGCVDEEPAAARQRDQLPVARGVASSRVPGPHLAGAQAVFTEQRVDQRGLADTRGAEQRPGAARPEVRGHVLQSLAADRADCVHRCVLGDSRRLGHRRGEIEGEVGLAQQHHRHCPALVREQEVAFQAARIVVAVEAHHHEDGIDVGRDDLLLGDLAGDLPREPAAARQHRLDGAGGLAGRQLHPHPVSDGRELAALRRPVLEAAGMLQLHLTRPRHASVQVIELDRHPRRDQVGSSGGVERRGPPRVPAEVLQGFGHATLG